MNRCWWVPLFWKSKSNQSTPEKLRRKGTALIYTRCLLPWFLSSVFLFSKFIQLHSFQPFSSRTHILLKGPNRHQLSYLFVFVLFVALKKRIPWKMCTLSFVYFKSVLFKLLCACDRFSECRQSTLFQILLLLSFLDMDSDTYCELTVIPDFYR